MDHRTARNQVGDRRTVRIVATGEEREVSYREAVGLVSRGRADWVHEKPKRARKPKKAPSAEAVYADPEAPLEATGSGRSDVADDPAPLDTSDLPSPTDGDVAETGGTSPTPIF